MTIELTTWGQSAVRLERDGRRLVFDPGDLSDLDVLEGADVVLVTHEHHDHVDIGAVTSHLSERPQAHVWSTRAVVSALVEAGADEHRTHVAVPDQSFNAAGFRVRVLGGEHAVIHADFSGLENVGYLVDGAVLHPGDAFTEPPADASVDVLLLPVWGPWLKFSDTVDYFRAVEPKSMIPIHDELVTAAGRAFTDQLMSHVTGNIDYRRLAPRGRDRLNN